MLSQPINKADETLYGFAAEIYKIGKLIVTDKLDNHQQFASQWVVQQSKIDDSLTRYAKIEAGKLQVEDPRGTTIWFKQKFEGPIMISYKVTAPLAFTKGNDIMPRDINQFWMANTPTDINVYAKGGLFDSTKYNGEFKPYDDLLTYYASTGGGNLTTNNRTVRMRRYPRSINGKLADHLGLNNRDDDTNFLIVPDKEHTIQLVAANDIVQYIFDGKVVYELKLGSEVNVFNDASKNVTKSIWGNAPFTFYNSGYFGFRLTRTHHNYSDFKVYRLVKK